MRIGRLHVIADASVQSRFDAVEIAERAIRGGADTIQYREKRPEATTKGMIEEAKRIRDLARRAGIPLIVNDRIDVAIAADADGVHLGTDDFPIAVARRLLGPHRVIGGSAGSEEEAAAAARAGADYLGCGPIYATASKADAGRAAGPDLLPRLAAVVELPLIAIGGIGPSNAAQVMQAGAHGIAVIAAVCASPDPEAATRELRAIIDAHSAPRETRTR